MIFFTVALVLAFFVVAGLTAYLAANERSQQNPHYFFIAALLSIAIGYGFKLGIDKMDASVRQIRETAQLRETEAANVENQFRYPEKAAQFFGNAWRTASIHTLEWHLEESRRKRLEAATLKKDAQDLEDNNASLRYVADLMALVSGAFAGALASVAITNRAKFKHDVHALQFLEKSFLEQKLRANKLADSIRASTLAPCFDEKSKKKVEQQKNELATLLREMEILSSWLTSKELENIEIPTKKSRRKRVKDDDQAA